MYYVCVSILNILCGLKGTYNPRLSDIALEYQRLLLKTSSHENVTKMVACLATTWFQIQSHCVAAWADDF